MAQQNKTFKFDPDVYNDTTLYVCVCPPQECVKVIKIGIAHSLEEVAYDGGIIVYSFSFHTREEAEFIEDLIKIDFQNAFVCGCLDALGAAKILNIPDVDPMNNYSDYVQIAKSLFAYLVNRVKTIWHTKYQGFNGFCYDIKSLQRNIITADIAEQMGIVLCSLESVIDKLQKDLHALHCKYRTLQMKFDAQHKHESNFMTGNVMQEIDAEEQPAAEDVQVETQYVAYEDK